MTYDLLNPTQLMSALVPDLILMVGAMGLMLWAAWGKESAERHHAVGLGAIVLVLVTLGAVVWMAMGNAGAEAGVIAVDRFRWTTDGIILLAALGTIALSLEYNRREGIVQAESHVLVLFAAAGAMILAAGRDLMIIFLGIEMMSVAVYVLAGLNRRSPRAAEASLKYFLLGAFATGFLLYGIALVYGATGATQLNAIATAIAMNDLQSNPMLLIGVGLLLIGFGFKVAAVPFHMWAPDVYDGAPTPITAFMAAAVKVAAFATFLRVWFESFTYIRASWLPPLWWIAAVTMVVGNVVALQQKNVKRMLAYSSIVHSGYLLVAVAAGTTTGSMAFLFYLLAYTLATFGAFGVVAALQRAGDQPLMIDDCAGLWRVRPGLAAMMAIYLLSLLGFPVFGGIGFFGKWYLLQAALASPNALVPLVVILVLTSVISAGYYLQLVRVMFMSPRPEGAEAPAEIGGWTRSVLGATAALILFFGLFPSVLVHWSGKAGFELPRVRVEAPPTPTIARQSP